MSFLIRLYFFSNVNNILNLFKYSNTINIYLDKVLYYNVIIKNNILINLLKNKDRLIAVLALLNDKINNFLFINIINFFLNLKKNLFKILKNRKLLIIKGNLKRCEILL